MSNNSAHSPAATGYLPPAPWRPMDTAPRDGTLLRLLVAFEDNATEDSPDPSPTIGSNNLAYDGEDLWKFAGWCWSHDHFTSGVGAPVGWLPMLDEPAASAVQRVAEHIGSAVEYIETVYPNAKQLDRGPMLRNMRHWARLLGRDVAAPRTSADDATPATLILRDLCEIDPADPDRPDSVCVAVDDIRRVAEYHTSAVEPPLWCLHLQGPDEVFAAPSKAHAEKAAKAVNAADDTGLVRAVASPWPHSSESHAEDVAKFITEWLIPGRDAEVVAQEQAHER